MPVCFRHTVHAVSTRRAALPILRTLLLRFRHGTQADEIHLRFCDSSHSAPLLLRRPFLAGASVEGVRDSLPAAAALSMTNMRGLPVRGRAGDSNNPRVDGTLVSGEGEAAGMLQGAQQGTQHGVPRGDCAMGS